MIDSLIKKSVLNNSGFSLVEIMVAISLGLMLLAGMAKIYLSVKSSYRIQQEWARLQENGRFAAYILRHDIDTAGYSGCIANRIPDAIRGYSKNSLPDYLRNKKINSDVIVVKKADIAITTLTQNVVSGATTLYVINNPASKKDIELLLADCAHVDIFTAKNFGGKRVIVKNGAINYSYNIADSTVAAIREDAYFISGNGLYLVRNRGYKRELVSGIENMQVKYRVNNTYYNAEQITNWDKVTSVDITLFLGKNKKIDVYIALKERLK